MKVYVDYVFFINFLFDFIILMGLNSLLKRNSSIKRLIGASVLGGVFTFIMYLDISSFLYFILKIVTGLIMVLVAFRFNDIKYLLINFIYLIILSVILGGFLYFINSELGYSKDGILYFTDGKVLNLIILLFLFLVITILFVKIEKKYKKDFSSKYEVTLFLNSKKLKLKGFVDTGNQLYDPYFNRPVVILNKGIDVCFDRCIYIPYNTISGSGVMKGFLVDKIYIKNIGYKKNIILGISNDKFHISGIDIILNEDLLEE